MRRTILPPAAAAIALVASLQPALAQQDQERKPVTTTVPDLRSVSILDGDPYDDDTEVVEYCFDQPIAESVTESGFTLVGSNAGVSVAAASAARAGRGTCVEARFAKGLEIANYTLGVVADDAVTGTDERPAFQAALPLQGSKVAPALGDTTRPELVDAIPDAEQDQVTYVFDEGLDPTITKPIEILPGIDTSLIQPADPAPSKFLLYPKDGAQQAASEVVAIERNTITVQFADGRVKDAVRFAVLTDAVPDRQQANRAGQKNPHGSVGEGTADPELTSARKVGGTSQIDFIFDEGVQAAAPASFIAYSEDGAPFTATRAILRDATTVRATFPTIGFADKIVAVAVPSGAVNAADNNDNNTIGWAAMAKSHAVPGATDAPDLVAAVVDDRDAAISFYFDRPIDRKPTPSAFRLIDSEGRRAAGQEIVDEADRVVTVGFHGAGLDVSTAIAATADKGAVKDLQGKGSPVGTLARNSSLATSSVGGNSPEPSPEPSQEPSPEPSSSAEGASQSEEITREEARSRCTPEFAGTTADIEGGGVLVVGTAGNDDIIGGAGPDVLCGLGGNDTIAGLGRADLMLGQGGNDTLKGGRGRDRISGGAGTDVVQGGGGRDRLRGGGGKDRLAGGPGSDVLRGGRGPDRLRGGAGDDILVGGPGFDVGIGGSGNDVFRTCEEIRR
jgi:hypothetical protein